MRISIHKNFELNGVSFSNEKELLLFSKTISSSVFSFLSDFLDNSEFVTVQTSGSTGTPKRIEIKKEFMVNSAKATGVFFDLQENTTALLCMSSYFIAGKMMLVRALVLGWQLEVVLPSSSPLKGIDKSYDFCAMVPLQVHHSLGDLHKIKKLIIGGGIVSKELSRELQNHKTEIFATYGMTETVTHIAVQKLNNFRHAELVSALQYSTLPNIKISIDNRNCLVIEAPKVAETIITTNDIVEIISETEFKWLGRFDSIINSGGIKLITEQIEDKLATIISQRFFITSIPDEILGEKVILIIEGKKINVILSETKNLTKYEIPKAIYFVDVFIETKTGKIQRKETLKLITIFIS